MRLVEEFTKKMEYTDSLQNFVPNQILSDPIAMAFQADYQSAGRGQHNNKWSSPYTGNCYITFMIKLDSMPLIAPLVAAHCISETLNEYLPSNDNQKFKIKWINDVYYQEKKVSGVLCTCTNIGSTSFLSMGLGVNLNSSPVEDTSICLKEIL